VLGETDTNLPFPKVGLLQMVLLGIVVAVRIANNALFFYPCHTAVSVEYQFSRDGSFIISA
jgi:hypothetical protein